MNLTGLKYAASFYDHSGYGEASRNFLRCINGKFPIMIEPVSFEPEPSSLYGEVGDMLTELSTKTCEYSHKLIHLTPENYPKLAEEGVKNIGFMYWETSHIPELWVDCINDCVDAQIVCCDYTRDALLRSGVNVPIYKVLPPFDATDFSDTVEDFSLGLNSDTYKFYSIFQWTERKYPSGLVVAYLTEFTSDDDVALVIKSYGSSVSASEQQKLKDMIARLRLGLYLSNFPPIYFIGNMLSREEIIGLHNYCDCFVLPHRSEGLGMPHAEAMASGNPVITTGLGGNTEFTKPHNSYLLRYFMEPVQGMPWIPWYNGTQSWGNPDLMQLRKYMRYVYENPEEALELGTVGKDTVETELNFDKVSTEFLEVLDRV